MTHNLVPLLWAYAVAMTICFLWANVRANEYRRMWKELMEATDSWMRDDATTQGETDHG